MEHLKLFGDHRSGNCYKAALLLKLTRTPFEWVETDIMQGKTHSEDFLALNPNGKVPLLLWPDGRCLAESNAMLLHLSRDTPYFPQDQWQQALVWQWLFFEQYSHEPAVAVLRFIISIARREAEEAARLVALRQKAQHALSIMEGVLRQSPFFVGGHFTVADIALYAYTHVAAEGGLDLHRYPAVQSWVERVSARPGHLSMAEACC